MLVLAMPGASAASAARRRTVPSPAPDALAQGIENSSETGSVGPGATGARVARVQILLDRSRFSPGEIDGRYGDDLGIAIKGYQQNHNLKPNGIIDAVTWKLLNTARGRLLTTYIITAADEKGPFDPIPAKAEDQANLKWMGYESPQEELGEKFHVSPKFLQELNPGLDLTQAGVRLTVPDVRRSPAGHALRVVVSKSKRTVTAYGYRDRVLAQYPATIGGPHDPLPIGSWTITSVIHNPWFNWDPVHFWNANPNEAAQKLPPGPNNPVGVVWMGLSKEHYGIHGTPDPGHVRHEESYGCIRLTNWDANDLSHMVHVGTPAILEE